MIVQFSVQNFRSIKELQTISFVTTGLKSSKAYSEVDENNIANFEGMKLLKTIGIYGANASGKSNILIALEYFFQAIKNEASSESNLSSLCDPFLYQEDAINIESFFQLVFFVNHKKYRYGFSVKKNPKKKEKPDEKYSNEIIVGEWLIGMKDKNMGEYFTREGLKTNKEKLHNSNKIPSLPYEHSLFLTHAAAFDSEGECAKIREYISGWTLPNFSNAEDIYRRNALILLDVEHKTKEFLKILSSFNLSYNDIYFKKDPDKPEQLNLPRENIFFEKSFKDKNNHLINITLNLKDSESSGTQKLFDIVGLLLRAFNMHISVFVIIDEIDSNFHPSLLINLIKLFNDPEINKSKSQLIFTSHDTNLMSPEIMRRDQFYFTEKNEDNSTRVYSLADLNGIRNDADFAKDYLAGYYGALPILNNYKSDNSENNE